MPVLSGRRLGLFLLLLLVSVVGCSGGGPGLERVSGSVQFKKQPLDQGTIQFFPQDAGGTFDGAEIKQGKYESPPKKGLKPGKYQVKIFSGDSKAKEDPVPGESGPPAKEKIPPAYNEFSKHVVEVKKGGPNVFDFDIPAK